MRRRLLPVALGLLILYPPLYSTYLWGLKAVFGFISADSFYYLTVGANSASGLFTSFDGVHRTNGFHPLWQFLLILLHRLFGPNRESFLVAAFWLGGLLVTAGLLFFGSALRKLTRSDGSPFWLLPGLFYVLFSLNAVRTVDLGITYTYSAWAFWNAMETPLTVFFGGVLMVFLSRQSVSEGGAAARYSLSHYWTMGFVAGLAVLSRLDDCFLTAALVLYVLLEPQRVSRRAAVIAVGAPTAVFLAAYMAWNEATLGLLMPASGIVKTEFVLRFNAGHIADDLFPLLPGAEDPTGWIYSAQRGVLLVFPMLMSLLLVYSWAARRRRGEPMPSNLRPFVPFCLYILLKGAYHMANTPLMVQGYWYYPLFILTTNCLLIVLGVEILRRARVRALPVLAAVWTALYLEGSANVLSRVGEDNWWYDVWRARGEIRAELLRREPEARLVDFSDGLFAYSLEIPSLASRGFLCDAAGVTAVRRRIYPRYCWEQGYRIAASSPSSYPPFAAYAAELIYEHPGTGVKFTRGKSAP